MAHVATQASTDSPAKRHWFFWFTAAAGIFFVAFAIFASVMIVKYFALEKYGFQITYGHDGQYVRAVSPQGPAQGKLQVGDKILAINNDSRLAPFFRLQSFPIEENYTIQIVRNGNEQSIELSAAPFSVSEPTRQERWRRIIIFTPRFLAYFIVALLIGLGKPQDKQARIATMAFLLVAHQQIDFPLQMFSEYFTPFEGRIAYFFGLLQGVCWFGAVGYHATYTFPPGVSAGRFWSLLKWALYLVAAVLFLNRLIVNTITQTSLALAFLSDYGQVSAFIERSIPLYFTTSFIALSGVLIRNNLLTKEPTQRRRVRLVLYGVLFGVLPTTVRGIIRLISFVTGYAPLRTGIEYSALDSMLGLLILIIPLSWGYVILKYQVYDINVVVRSGVKYLLAKNAFRILLALPIIGALYGIISKPDRPLKDLLFDHQ